jgi:hypothetical protein
VLDTGGDDSDGLVDGDTTGTGGVDVTTGDGVGEETIGVGDGVIAVGLESIGAIGTGGRLPVFEWPMETVAATTTTAHTAADAEATPAIAFRRRTRARATVCSKAPTGGGTGGIGRRGRSFIVDPRSWRATWRGLR